MSPKKENGILMATRYFEGFIDHHPSFEVACDICAGDVAMFTDINTFECVCLDCCDDLWFAKMQMKTLNLYIEQWKL